MLVMQVTYDKALLVILLVMLAEKEAADGDERMVRCYANLWNVGVTNRWRQCHNREKRNVTVRRFVNIIVGKFFKSG